MDRFCVAAGRLHVSGSSTFVDPPAGGPPVEITDREAAILSALATPTGAAALAATVRRRLADGTPERFRALAGTSSPIVRTLMSLTSGGRRWRQYLSGWSDADLASDLARLESRDWVRTFSADPCDGAVRTRGIGIICGRPGPALARLGEELATSRVWFDEDVVVVSGDSGPEQLAGRQAWCRVIGRTERGACIARLTAHGIAGDVVRGALCGDEAGPNIGANRNLLTLASGFSTVVSIDDDVHARAYTRWGQPTNTEAAGQPGDPREWVGGRTMEGFLRRLFPAVQTIPELLSRRLGARFRDIAAADPAMSWRDLDTWRLWPARWWDARVRLAWTGVIGHTGMGLTRRVLHFEGESRRNVIRHSAAYKAVTETGIAEVCAPCEALLPAGFFAGGAFAYDQSSLVPPFPSAGRGEEGVFSAVLHRIDRSALIRAVPAMVWHEPVDSRDHGRSIVDARLRGNHVLSALIARAPVSEKTVNGAARMAEIGDYLEALGSLPAGSLAGAFASHGARQLEETWAELFRLRATYDGPEWWLRDVEEMSLAIERLVSSDSAPEDRCRAMFSEPIETVARRTREYGRLLQAWPALWARRAGG